MINSSVIFYLLLVTSCFTTSEGDNPSTKFTNQKFHLNELESRAILQNAHRYKIDGKNVRRLEDSLQIDGSYSLKFSECLDITIRDDDLFTDDIIPLVQNGHAVSSKSFVLFHACQGADCYYESDNDLFMIDLPNYLKYTALYYAYERNDYCNTCEMFEDYCTNGEVEGGDEIEENEDGNYDEYSEEGDDEYEDEQDVGEEEEEENDGAEDQGAEDEAGEGNRNLKQKTLSQEEVRTRSRRRIKNSINCRKCAKYECFNSGYYDMQSWRTDHDYNVGEWISDLAECKQTGRQWNNMTDLYVSVMCNSYGDGVEPAVFLDESCTIHTNEVSFGDVYHSFAKRNSGNRNKNTNVSHNGKNNYYQSQNYNTSISNAEYIAYTEKYVKKAFSDFLPCQKNNFNEFAEQDDANTKFYDMNFDDQIYLDDDFHQDDDFNQDDDFTQIRSEANDYCRGIFESGAIEFKSCYSSDDDDDYVKQNYEYVAGEYRYEYGWYSFDMTAEDAQDIGQVCSVVRQMSGEYSRVYDEEATGTWYTRNKKGEIIGDGEKEKVFTVDVIGLITLFCFATLGLILCNLPKDRCQRDVTFEPEPEVIHDYRVPF